MRAKSTRNNLRLLPNKQLDEVSAAMAELARIMPKQAALAKEMQEAFIAAGFTEDDALKLVAYAIFH